MSQQQTGKQHITIIRDGEIIFEGWVESALTTMETVIIPVPHKFTAADFTDPPKPTDDFTLKTEMVGKVALEITTTDAYEKKLKIQQAINDVYDNIGMAKGGAVYMASNPIYDEPYKYSSEKPDPTKVADLLEKAAEILERDAWVKGHLHDKVVKEVIVDDEGVVVR